MINFTVLYLNSIGKCTLYLLEFDTFVKRNLKQDFRLDYEWETDVR